MPIPESLSYTKEHQWVSFDGETALVGITTYALEQLGDIVHIELPRVGQNFKAGDPFGTVESIKTVSDIYMPIEGTVLDVNLKLKETPESLGDDPYVQGWLVKVQFTGQKGNLMNFTEYTNYIKDN